MPITPYLYYEDVAGAIRFLSQAFGFRKQGRPETDKSGTIKHAAMRLGDDLIMMGDPGPSYKNPRKLEQATQCLYVNVEDVDSHFARASKAGAKVLEEPKDTFYGHRRCGVEDPEGHQWYFAQQSVKRPNIKKRKAGHTPKAKGRTISSRERPRTNA